MVKVFLTYFLQFLARLILRKYRPTVVGITGSVGKTSAKEAIFAVLVSKFSVRCSQKNYNNELGVPLTIIGTYAPGASPLKWAAIVARALWIILVPVRYPAILVLEMGADRPHDIEKLVKLAPVRVAVVTAVSAAHTEFFGSIKRVAVEKRRLVEAVPKPGTAILNFDDEMVRTFAEYTDGKVMGYGITASEAEMRAVEITEYLASLRDGRSSLSDEFGGVHFKIMHEGSAVPVHLPNVLGYSHVYAALSAAAVGRVFQMNMVEISRALLRYKPPPGRMRLIAGVKKTILIDDTYNSSPRAAVAALETLGRLNLSVAQTFRSEDIRSEDLSDLSPRRYAVLADMLELGTLNEASHREVGRAAAQSADVVIAVGASAAWIVEEAIKSGMSKDRVFHFHMLEEGVEHFLQERIQPGDVLLIKGSQGMRMEKLVKSLMAEPLQASELICRQDKEWEKR